MIEILRFIGVFIMLFFISCSNGNYHDEPEHEGTLFSEEIEKINVDGSRLLMKYDGNKRLLDSLSYNAEGNLHGVIMITDTLTKTKYYHTYNNGKNTGLTRYYFPSGKLEFSGFFVDGVNSGENFFYYEKGNIKSFECKDPESRLVYQRDYDTLGEIVKSEGFLAYYYGLNRDTISLGDSLYFELIMGRPPFSNVRLSIGSTNGESFISSADFHNAKYPVYIEYPKDTGWITRRLYYEVEDTVSGYFESYTDDIKTYVIRK